MKKYLILLILLITCSGCVKYNVNMNINSDKSMNLKIIYAVEKSLSTEALEKTQLEELKKEGYTFKKYDKDSYTGYTISKKIKNIDEVSTTKDYVGNIDITKDNKYLFKVKKGIFKNTYTYTTETENSSNNNALSDSFDYSKTGMEMNLNVTLPYKALKSNATKVKKDGKELTWDLLKLKDEKIILKFELYNITNIVLSILGIIAVIVIICFIVKKKHNVT